MLKLIHVQARLSVNKGQASVRQMQADDSTDYQRAADIIQIFREALATQLNHHALDAKLTAYTGTRLDYREIDALAKVITDSFVTFEPTAIGFEPLAQSIPQPTSALEPDQSQKNADESPALNMSAWRLAAWREAAKPENYPFGNVGLTVALKPSVQSLRRAVAAHDEDLLSRLLPASQQAAILQKAAAACGYKLNAEPDKLDSSLLYIDLPGRHRLTSLSQELNVQNLLNRYNIELLRGVLYLAPRLRIVVRDKYKDLFKFIKLFGLMHELKPFPLADLPKPSEATTALELKENQIGGYEIILEGASSPFLARSDRRYGIQFAKFLPALLLCEAEWSLEAELVFNPAGGSAKTNHEAAATPTKDVRLVRALYKLGPQPQLRSHFRASGEFDSLLEENFAAAFEQRFNPPNQAAPKPEKAIKTKHQAKTRPDTHDGWTMRREDRIIPVFDTVMIPDFAFEHNDGRRALLEIVGFWERGYLERKIAKLNRAGRTDIIVLVSERTRCGRENFLVKGQEPPYQLIFFKGTPRLGPIMEALERCAV